MSRLLVIEAAGNLWGSERALLDLLDGLNGMEIAVCCPPDSALETELVRRGIKVFPYYIYELHKKPRWRRLLAALGVLRACRAWRPDLVYLNQSGAYRTVLPAAWLLNLPLVGHVRIFEDIEYLARQSPQPLRLRGLIAISQAVEQAVRRAPALRAIRCHTLYDAYARQQPPAAMPERNTELACVGRIVPVKGQDILIDGLSRLAATGRSPACLMAGDGDADYLGRLKASAPPSVSWLGRVGDVVGLMRRCRVSVCPSRAEPLGRVIFEAWDAGALPVACALSGGAAEVIAASGGGLLYPEATGASLAEAIVEALSLTADQRDERVRRGQEWLESNCNPALYGTAVSAIFESAIAETKA
jgi:glycosyltransferase involved in cell wall biosynthesis